ncbi:MAG: TVP38/TMEM64 family protein [Gomphosphaeria aponina SAG 52.96 = DSM 107014]|uniref:TVP38/TMEM64 family membrane protein n=1 Tax=Gomphosphaeria aponina SAG 52.96 = DSM 107014 TaxID=1521640 RepID=A0A941GXD1_9CHRO|nr:TVP38/TMEM64 family protein [Gomphosphaeria aponina SAG 52.96 = DSM 107014]
MSARKKKKLNQSLKVGIIVVGVAGLIIAAKQLGVTEIINSILQYVLQWIDSLGTAAPVMFTLIYILASVLLISGAVITLGAGVLFGVIKGSILVSIASTLAATASFIIGRYLARGWVTKQIENRPKFKAIDAAVAQEGWKIVGLTRLSPVFPFVFLNYAFALTQVSLKDYIIASWIGMMPGTIMYVYLGSLAKSLATLGSGNEQPTSLEWVIRIVGFIATVAVTVYVTKIAQKALDNEIKNETDTNSDSEKKDAATQV